jgi:hypothetical protein
MPHGTATALTQRIDPEAIEPIAKSLPQRELERILGIRQVSEISTKKKANIDAIEKFIYKDDHWQDGDAWLGWKPASTTNPAADEKADWEFVASNFVYKNILKRIPQRIEGAVLGYRPHIEIINTETGATSDVSPEQEEDSELKELHTNRS